MLVRTDVDLMLMQSIASCIVESSLLVQHQCQVASPLLDVVRLGLR